MPLSKPIPLDSDQARLAQMLKALGNPLRFKIIEYLAVNQACQTQQIVAATPLAQSTISQHLKVLREAGLINGEIDGPATCYCLDVHAVLWLKNQIEAWLPGCCPTDSSCECAPTNQISQKPHGDLHEHD